MIMMELSSEATETAFLLLDTDGKILNANKIALKFYGYRLDELLSMNAAELRIPSERQKFLPVFKECLKESCFVETTHLRKDGSTFPAEVAYNGILIGSIQVVACVIRDLTIQKRVEKEREDALILVRDTNGELQAILDIISATGTLNFSEMTNTIIGRLRDIFHASSGVILLREDSVLRAFTAPGLEEEVRSGFTIPVGTGFAGTIASTGKHMYIRDAQTEPLVKNEIIRKADVRSMLGVPIVNQGEVIGVMHIEWKTLHDFNERELCILEIAADRCGNAIVNARLYQETQTLQNLSALLLDLMSHDINNLNQIGIGFLELAHNKIESGITIGKEDIHLIDKALETMQNSSTLIENVSKIMRQRTGKIPLISIDLCDILKEIQRHYSQKGTKTVTINLKETSGCYVLSNELLYDVFANLITNAIRHSPDTYDLIIDIGVDVVMEYGHSYYLVTVSDNGPGIPDELKPKLFSRFQIGEKKGKGSGLGLYLVKTLVEAFNGTVRVEDRVPGDYTKGAKFMVKLPASIFL
jgi:PAS domain S-box-containing protein